MSDAPVSPCTSLIYPAETRSQRARFERERNSTLLVVESDLLQRFFGTKMKLIVVSDIWGAQQLRTGCLSILMFLAPLAEVTP